MSDYDASELTRLALPHEAMRHRPAMYLGEVDSLGLHLLARFFLEAVLEGARSHGGGEVVLELHADGALSVFGSDRLVLTRDIAQVVEESRSEKTRGYWPWGWYSELSLSLALSSRFQVDAWEGGRQWRARGERGVMLGEATEVTPAEPVPAGAARGVRVDFTPDAAIFGKLAFESEQLLGHCRDLAVLAPGLRVRFIDRARGRDTVLHYPGGIVEGVKELTASQEPLHPEPLSFEVSWKDPMRDVRVRCVLQWCAKGGEVLAFANTARTEGAGAHVDGVFMALGPALATVAGARPTAFSRPRLKRGLTAVITAEGLSGLVNASRNPKRSIAIPELKKAVCQQLPPLLVETLRDHPVTPHLIALGRNPRQGLK